MQWKSVMEYVVSKGFYFRFVYNSKIVRNFMKWKYIKLRTLPRAPKVEILSSIVMQCQYDYMHFVFLSFILRMEKWIVV